MGERVALVVGAGGALGRATAVSLARAGFSVVAIGDGAAAVSGALLPAYGA